MPNPCSHKFLNEELVIRFQYPDITRVSSTGTDVTAGAFASMTTRPSNDEDDDAEGSWFFPRRPLERDEQLDEKLLQDYRRMSSSTAYQKTLPFREKLPAFQKRDRVMKLIHAGNVCVISGATGSGKTTQIPQFVLDEALEKGESEEERAMRD